MARRLDEGARARLAAPAYQRIYAVVDSIPRGRVASYGTVAREAGLPGRARLVGYALRTLPQGSCLAWHRVVGARGQVPERAHAPEQRARLRREGVRFGAAGRIDLGRYGWQGGDER